jgi:hypothetical protein
MVMSQAEIDKVPQIPTHGYYSIQYFEKNILQYLAGLLGGSLRVMGVDFVLISPIIGFIGLIAVFLNPLLRKQKLISVYLLLSFLVMMLFVCFFFATDGRYLFIFVPVFILSFAIFINWLRVILKSMNRDYIYWLIITIILMVLSYNLIPQFKTKIVENFSSTSTSINYPVIQGINDFFKDYKSVKKPFVLSIIPPYTFDFYPKSNYTLLPLSHSQYFMESAEITWGPNDYSNLTVIYKRYLDEGYPVFASNYKILKGSYFYQDWELLKVNFNLEKVKEGCSGNCDIYQIKLK